MVDILKSIGQFIGPDKINTIKEVDRKTYSGKNVYEVEFVDGRKVEYPEYILDSIITEKQGDYNSLREKVVVEPLKQIQMILLDAELTLEDINYIGQTKIPVWIEWMISSVYKNFWGKDRIEVTVRDANEMLNKNGK